VSEPKKVINAAEIDAALQNIEKSFSETKITLEKSVDKRAMGGDQTPEAGNEVISAPGDDRTGLPKVGAGTREVSKLQGNFAEKYPMDGSAPGGLEAAVAASVKAPTRDKEPVNKAVEQSAEPGSISKAADQSSESSKIVKAADASSSSTSSKKKVEKAADASSSSTSSKKKNPFAKGVVPAEKPASETAASGAPQLKKSMKLIASAKKHLAKAYEGGSDSELETAGNRLVEAKTTILKAMKDGESVPAEIVKSLDKAANYFGKALASFENDKIEEHVKSVEKADKHMAKALNAFDFKSTSVAPIEKSVTTEKNEIKFNHKDGKVVAEMTEAQFKQVEKALNEKGLYKSFLDTVSKEQKSTIDALPILKSLVDGLRDSQNSLRDNLVANAQKDNDFKKSVSEALTLLAKASKQNTSEVEALKNVPQVRKSILTEVKSPLEVEVKPAFEKSQVTEIIEKGIRKGICDKMVLLAWDVDKDLPAEYQEKYVKLCEKIQRS
jgi:hypothetical protein